MASTAKELEENRIPVKNLGEKASAVLTHFSEITSKSAELANIIVRSSLTRTLLVFGLPMAAVWIPAGYYAVPAAQEHWKSTPSMLPIDEETKPKPLSTVTSNLNPRNAGDDIKPIPTPTYASNYSHDTYCNVGITRSGKEFMGPPTGNAECDNKFNEYTTSPNIEWMAIDQIDYEGVPNTINEFVIIDPRTGKAYSNVTPKPKSTITVNNTKPQNKVGQ